MFHRTYLFLWWEKVYLDLDLSMLGSVFHLYLIIVFYKLDHDIVSRGTRPIQFRRIPPIGCIYWLVV
nr:hypothetical protein Q903MT_gene1988 [Picea sitchensis]